MSRSQWIVIVLAILVSVVCGTVLFTEPVAARDHNDGDNTTYPETVTYWSLDEDLPNQSVNEMGENEALARLGDKTWEVPPNNATVWNQQNVNTFINTNYNRSRFPESARDQLVDSGYIKDAYIKIHSLSPSTIVHHDGDETYNYINRNSSVHATIDFRMTEPENELEGTPVGGTDDDLENESEIYHDIERTNVDRVWIEQDGSIVAHRENPVDKSIILPADESPNGGFERTDFNEDTTISIHAQISGIVNKTIYRQHDECLEWHDHSSNNSSNTSSSPGGDPINDSDMHCHEQNEYWYKDDIALDYYTTSVSDQTEEWSVYNITAEVEYAKYPDGHMEVKVNPDGDRGLWDGFTLPNGERINSQWKYYTVRDTGWDTVYERDNSSEYTVRPGASAIGHWSENTSLRPIEVHAYPEKNGSYYSADRWRDRVVDRTAWGDHEPPELQDGVSVRAVDTPYEITHELVMYAGPYTNDSVTIDGVVEDAQVETKDVARTEVLQSDVSLSVVEVDRANGSATVEVSVTDANDGRPINTRARGPNSYVLVENKTVNTDDTGTATVDVNLSQTTGSAYVGARFVARPWWEGADEMKRIGAGGPGRTIGAGWNTPHFYTNDSTAVIVYGDQDISFFDVLMTLFQIFLWFLPLFFILWVTDRAFHIGWWPPWKGNIWETLLRGWKK